MRLHTFFQSKIFHGTLMVLGILFVLLLVLKLGMFVGYRKASFSYRWGEQYHRNFAGPRGGIYQRWEGKDLIDAHGISGTIITHDGEILVMRGQDDVEKTIVVSEKTAIMKQRARITSTDLRSDDRIVVLGAPTENGQIEARLIRVF